MVTTVVWRARQTPSAEVVFDKQKHTSYHLFIQTIFVVKDFNMFSQNTEDIEIFQNSNKAVK